MSITLIEYSKRLNGVIKDLQGGANGQIMAQVASDALAMVKKRVQDKGENAEGAKFPAYSTKPMLASRKGMTGKAYSSIAGSKDKRRELEWVTINGHKLFSIPGGYKQYRDLSGRQSGFVDFTFTGSMWNNIKLISPKSELDSGVAVIKPTKDIEKKKLAGNTERKGEILALSDKEKQRLVQIYESGIENVFRKNQLV